MLMEELEKVGYQKCIRYTGMYTTININNVHCGSCRFFFFFFLLGVCHLCVVLMNVSWVLGVPVLITWSAVSAVSAVFFSSPF